MSEPFISMLNFSLRIFDVDRLHTNSYVAPAKSEEESDAEDTPNRDLRDLRGVATIGRVDCSPTSHRIFVLRTGINNDRPRLFHFPPRRGENALNNMPFARVGAMPQPTSNRQRNGHRKDASSTSSRPKGITMEDLKKQTALRLAQEQHQKQGVSGYVAEPSRDRPLQPLPGHQLSGYGQFAHPQPTVFVNQPGHHPYASTRGVLPTPLVGFTNPQPPFQMRNPHLEFNQASGYDVYGNPHRAQSFEQTENRQLSPRDVHPHAPGPRQDIDNVQRSHFTPSDFTPADAAQPVPGADGASLRSSGKAKQKLPHGLTVHELKEMTKARLQAEAADIPESGEPRELSIDSRRLSPLDFDSVPEVRERAFSRDSGYNNNNLLHHGPGSTSSIPSMVQVNSQSRDSAFGRQPQVSPLPAGFHNSGTSFQQPKVDAWETISVASHNSTVVSENYGSDSAYSGGLGSGYAQPSESDMYIQGTPFNGQQRGAAFEETISYSSSAHASPSNANSLFDATIGGNRRRAMTHSPRAISIHEDRPILPSDELIMPNNFSSSSRGTLQSRPSSRNFSPVLGLGLDDSYLGQNAGLAPLGGTDLNRTRTSSVTSLPLSSHGALEFNRDRANTFSGFSTGQPRADGLTDSISNALTDSFLRVSQHEAEGSVNHNSHAFSEGITAPPGFGSNNIPSTMVGANHVPAFSQGGPVNIARQSSFPNTWDEPNQTVVASGSTWFGAQGIEDLANSMGSILKLSGVGSDRPDRERSNTYPHSSFR